MEHIKFSSITNWYCTTTSYFIADISISTSLSTSDDVILFTLPFIAYLNRWVSVLLYESLSFSPSRLLYSFLQDIPLSSLKYFLLCVSRFFSFRSPSLRFFLPQAHIVCACICVWMWLCVLIFLRCSSQRKYVYIT